MLAKREKKIKLPLFMNEQRNTSSVDIRINKNALAILRKLESTVDAAM